MVTRALKSRRRPIRASGRAVETIDRPGRPSFATNVARFASSGPARAAYVTIGALGLAALAVAVVGPKRIEKDVLRPLKSAIEPQVDRMAEKIWAQAQPLREQIAGLFQAASPNGRARLVKSFQSWIGHFQAT